MRFGVLGPLTVHDGSVGEELVISRAKSRTVLAILLCTPGTPVTADRLIDELWPEAPPSSAVRNLHVYIHQLRKVLGVDRIESTRNGYLLHASEDELDTSRFLALEAQARTARGSGEMRRAVTLLRSALRLWRDEPFTGCGSSPLLDAEATRWRETRLSTWHRCLDLELACGRHRDIAPELQRLVERYPLAEGFRAQLMLALYRSGRAAEALDAFASGRSLIARETGLDPGHKLAELQRAILREDPAIASAGQGEAERPGSHAIAPAQLPTDIDDFTGRDKQVHQLCALLTDDTTRASAPIAVVAGRGGVGKTTLAVHAAHRLADRFDDGHLHVDLRGAEARPLEPAEVLGRWLLALGIDGASIPEHAEERAGLYRTHLAKRRVLVVLDNAADERQIRPLLPAGRDCGVLVTSRGRLAALEGAQRLDLDALDPEQAIELLSRIAGHDRIAAEPAEAERVARLCGYLPLALRVAGARLSAHPEWSLSRYAAHLADERSRLDELAVGDMEVRGSLALSYQGIPPLAGQALRMLGTADLPEFAPWILSPLLEVDTDTAESLAEDLQQAQLLDALGEDMAGQLRYRLHDLVRLYARERAADEDPAHERRAALRRLVSSWLWLANRGADTLRSGLPRPRRGAAPQQELDPELTAALLADPLAWFESEAPALIAAVDLTDTLDLDESAWELFSALVAGRFMLGSQFDEWWHTYQAAIAVVRRSGNRHGAAIMDSGIGLMYFRQDSYLDAIEHFGRAATVFGGDGNHHEEAIARCGLGISLASHGKPAEALSHIRYAEATFREGGDRHAIACASEVSGAIQTAGGAYAEALEALHRALDGYRVSGDPRGEANTCARIGRAHLALGDHAAAAGWSEQARGLFSRLSDRAGHAESSYDLATALFQQGQQGRAQRALRQCLETYEELGRHSSAARVLSRAGQFALGSGHLDEAAEYLERAEANWVVHDQPLWRARNLLLVGDLHHARGDGHAARQAWSHAQDIFADLGSPEISDATTRLGTPRPG